jgi:prepilin-type N-terminal cleavage/methylation domain-containing protein
MKNNAFTLIEVLIVVIILGILATIAIPQFAKVVRRTRLAEAQTNLAAIRDAQWFYYHKYVTYSNDLDRLDTDLTMTHFEYSVEPVAGYTIANSYNVIARGNTDVTNGMTAWYAHDGSHGEEGF